MFKEALALLLLERILELASYFCADHIVHLYYDWNLAIGA